MPGLLWLWNPSKDEIGPVVDIQMIKNKPPLKSYMQNLSKEINAKPDVSDCKKLVTSVSINEVAIKNGSVELPPYEGAYETLWMELNTAMRRTPGERNGRYIPKSTLHELIDFETIKRVLEQSSSSNTSYSEQYLKNVSCLAPRLFAVIVLLRLPLQLLERLMDVEFYDINLPWTGPPPKALNELDAAHFVYLVENQWQFTAASFDQIGKHETLNANIIIPFLKRDPCGLGVFSTVSRIKLAQSHQNLYSTPGNPNPDLALKVIHQYMDSASTFTNETTLLRGLEKLQDPHIVKLLYTYEQNDMYHLIFPAAECSFDVYMNSNPEGFGEKDENQTRAFTKWILSQLAGIAKAIANMHEWTCGGTDPGSTAYHHDLKPSNLLLFKELDFEIPRFGILQIADFGSGKLRSPNTGTGTTTFRGTPTYAAPESIIPRISNNGKLEVYVSRSYDVWSLGCISMEVLVWLIFGAQGRQDFSKDRFGPISSTEENDGYFVLNSNGQARIRERVTDWVGKLGGDPRLSQSSALAGLLELVVDVLEVDPGKRMSARYLASRLNFLTGLVDGGS